MDPVTLARPIPERADCLECEWIATGGDRLRELAIEHMNATDHVVVVSWGVDDAIPELELRGLWGDR